MSDNPEEDQVPDEEIAPDEEVTPEEEPFTAEKLRSEFIEIGTRARSAGLKPLRQMVKEYLNNALDAADGLLSAFEGTKRKKGD